MTRLNSLLSRVEWFLELKQCIPKAFRLFVLLRKSHQMSRTYRKNMLRPFAITFPTAEISFNFREKRTSKFIKSTWIIVIPEEDRQILLVYLNTFMKLELWKIMMISLCHLLNLYSRKLQKDPFKRLLS